VWCYRLWHLVSIILVISSGDAKITDALSPIIPAGVIAGAPFFGPPFAARPGHGVIACNRRAVSDDVPYELGPT